MSLHTFEQEPSLGTVVYIPTIEMDWQQDGERWIMRRWYERGELVSKVSDHYHWNAMLYVVKTAHGERTAFGSDLYTETIQLVENAV